MIWWNLPSLRQGNGVVVVVDVVAAVVGRARPLVLRPILRVKSLI
jgi:hypothetical protein